MSARLFVLAALGVGLGSAVPASAQLLTPPPRSTAAAPATDPDRPFQTLTITGSLVGSYDDDLTASSGSVSTSPLAPRQAGTATMFGTATNYRWTKGFHSFGGTARTYMNSFRTTGVRRLFGGDAEVNAATRLFGKTNIDGRAQTDYRPTLAVTSFAAGAGELPDAVDPLNGLSAARSRNSNAVLTISQEWNARHETSLSGNYTNRHFYTRGFDTIAATAQLRHRTNLTQNFSVRTSVQALWQGVQLGGGAVRPLESQTATIAFELQRPFSATRRLLISGGPAATHVKTISAATNQIFEYVAPSGVGSLRLDVGRSWSISADWNRQTTTLDGLTRQTFLTDSLALSLGGGVGEAFTFVASGSRSHGAPHEGDTGSFRGMNSNIQLEYLVFDCCSVYGNYTYYQHRLLNIANLPEGFPGTVDRASVRVGMSVSLSLLGRAPRAATRARGRAATRN